MEHSKKQRMVCHDALPLQPRYLHLRRLRDCAAGEGAVVDRDIRLSPKAIRLTDERSEELSQSESYKKKAFLFHHVVLDK